MISKWIRIVHRWLAVPLLAAVLLSIGWSVMQGPTQAVPGPLGALGVFSILALFITGLHMFVQHYWVRYRRSRRRSTKLAASPGTGD